MRRIGDAGGSGPGSKLTMVIFSPAPDSATDQNYTVVVISRGEWDDSWMRWECHKVHEPHSNIRISADHLRWARYVLDQLRWNCPNCWQVRSIHSSPSTTQCRLPAMHRCGMFLLIWLLLCLRKTNLFLCSVIERCKHCKGQTTDLQLDSPELEMDKKSFQHAAFQAARSCSTPST